MRICRILPLAALSVAIPLAASAQYGGMPGLPGGTPDGVPGLRGFGGPQAGPPPACRELLAMRDEVQKHGTAIRKANERKATVQEACKLFNSFLGAEAKFIKSLEGNTLTCGVPLDAIKQAKEGHAKASQTGKQVCDAAARGVRRAGTDPWDALQDFQNPERLETHEGNCSHCGNTGDFWPNGFWKPSIPGH
jgi:hypothetical protein